MKMYVALIRSEFGASDITFIIKRQKVGDLWRYNIKFALNLYIKELQEVDAPRYTVCTTGSYTDAIQEVFNKRYDGKATLENLRQVKV